MRWWVVSPFNVVLLVTLTLYSLDNCNSAKSIHTFLAQVGASAPAQLSTGVKFISTGFVARCNACNARLLHKHALNTT